jgi:ubiquinone/menaquinone biosynthesis C-methylase UbiE
MQGRPIAFLAALVILSCAPLESGTGSQTSAERLAGALQLHGRSTVAEIGAGKGELTVDMARTLGPQATLFTTELASELDSLRAAVRDLPHVSVIEALPDDANLPESCCDAIVLKRVYHHFQKPQLNNASMFRALRPGGKLAVIDFPPRAGWDQPHGTPDRGGHGVSIEHLSRELRSAGFERIAVEERWEDGMFLAIYGKP